MATNRPDGDQLLFDSMALTIQELTEATDRVREIHKPVTHHGLTFCRVCTFDGIPEGFIYPCPTIKALDEEQG